MSALVMGLVWETAETENFGRAEKYVLLAYADHADSNGKNIYPSIALVSKKTFYEERSIQATTRNLEKLGLLIADGVGPHGTNRWRIPILHLPDGGAKIAPVQIAVQKIAPEGIAPEGIAPEPSVVVKSFNDDDDERVKKSKNATLYEQEIGALTPLIADALADAEKEYPLDWIPEAIQIAVERNARNWKYVLTVLQNAKVKNVRPSLNKLKNGNGIGNKPSAKGMNSNSPSPASIIDQVLGV